MALSENGKGHRGRRAAAMRGCRATLMTAAVRAHANAAAGEQVRLNRVRRPSGRPGRATPLGEFLTAYL